MSDVGNVIIGSLLFVGGAVLSFTGVATTVGLIMMNAGAALLQAGIYGLNEEQASITSNTTGQQTDIPIIYGKDVKIGHVNADVFTYGDSGDILYMAGVIGVTSDNGGQGLGAYNEVYNDAENAVMATNDMLMDTWGTNDWMGIVDGVTDDFAAASSTIVGTLPITYTKYSYHAHSGADTDNAVDQMLNYVRPTAWPTTSKGDGLAYIVNCFRFNEETYSAFPQLTYIVDGNKIEDFRTSGPTLYDSYTNPALVLYDYLVSKRYGLGLDPSEIDIAGTFTSAANWCDLTTSMGALEYGKLIAYGGGLACSASSNLLSGDSLLDPELQVLNQARVGDQIRITSGLNDGFEAQISSITLENPRAFVVGISSPITNADTKMEFEIYDGTSGTPYEIPNAAISGVLRTGSSHKDNLDKILDAMRGKLYWQDGKVKLWVRKPETAQTFVLDADTNVDEIEIVRAGIQEVYNTVSARYVDPSQKYEIEEIVWPAYTDAPNLYLAEDNDVPSQLEIEYPLIQDAQVAWKFAEVALKESRQDVTVRLTTTEAALQFSLGDVVKLNDDTAGWTVKEFWVFGMTLKGDSTIEMLLKEYDSSVYTSSGQMTESGVPGGRLPSPLYMAAPTGLTLLSDETTVIVVDGASAELQQIKVDWTPSISTNVHKEEVFYRQTGDTEWIHGGFRYPHEVNTTTNVQTVTVGPVEPETGHDVKVEAVSNLGVRSAPVSGTITTGAVEPIGGGTGGSCPNIMGADSIYEQGGLDAATGTVVQYTYIDAWLNGVVPGESYVSFCAEMWVGPTDDPFQVSCSGKLGKVRSGLLWSMDKDANNESLGSDWHRTDTIRAQVQGTEYGINRGGYLVSRKVTNAVWTPDQLRSRYAWEFPRIGLGQEGHMGIVYNPNNTGFDQVFVAWRHLNEGSSMIQSDGSIQPLDDAKSSHILGLTAPGDLFRAINSTGYYTSQPNVRFLLDTDADNAAYEYVAGSTYGGLYDGQAVSILYRSDTGASLGSYGSVGRADRQVRMFVRDGLQFYFDGNGSVVATDTTHEGPFWPEFGWDNQSGNHPAGVIGYLGKNVDVGMGWHYDLHIMTDHKIRVTGLTAGDYVQIGNPSDTYNPHRWARSLEGANASGEVDVYTIQNAAIATADGVTTDCPASQTVDFPIIGSFEIWDDKPWSGGTRTYECASNTFEFYGGDEYVYDSAGTLVDTGTTVANVSAVLVLSFIGTDGEEISSVETAGYSGSTPGTRTGLSNTLVPAGTKYLRVRLEKRGTGSGWAKAQFVQLNTGSSCCSYSTPTSDWYPVPWQSSTPEDDQYDPSTQIIPGGVTIDVTDEHRQGGGNLLPESRDERTIAAAAGDQDGDDYPRVTLSEYGIEPGDVISIRGKAKIT